MRTNLQGRVEKMWGFAPTPIGKTCLSALYNVFLAAGNFRHPPRAVVDDILAMFATGHD